MSYNSLLYGAILDEFDAKNCLSYITLSDMGCLKLTTDSSEIDIECNPSPHGEVEVGFFKRVPNLQKMMEDTGLCLSGTFFLHGYDLSRENEDDVLCKFSGSYFVYRYENLIAFVKA